MTVAVTNIGQLLTLAGAAHPRTGKELRDLGILTDAALIVDAGRIVAVGSRVDLAPQIAAASTVIDAEGACVTPGFVDAHTHLVFAGDRAAEFEQRIDGATYQEIAASGGGILRTVKLTGEASEDALLQQSQKHLQWMLRGGTTTLEVKSGYGLTLDAELKMLRVIKRLNESSATTLLPTLLGAHALPAEFASHREYYVRWVIDELIPLVAREKLAVFSDVFCDDHAFTVAEARQIQLAARAHGMALRLHAEQFRPGTGAALAAEVGALTADHLETIEQPEVDALRKAQVQPVLLPGSVFALSRTQYPPARRMVEGGLAIVLATDFNPGSSPIASMPFTISLACVAMRLTPAEAITAATINAAYSLQQAHRVGSLEVGKQADFLIHEFDDYRQLAYFIAAPMRPRVFVAGAEQVL